MGAFNESIRRVTLHKLGLFALRQKRQMIVKLWERIEKALDDLDLSYEKVRLYQDGLPVCDKELEIATELADAGSRNHRLLLSLIERGARLMGTESPELLVEEYNLIKKYLLSSGKFEGVQDPHQKALSNSLLRKRDWFIATRINETLQVGETGILFLGMLHPLEEGLSKDIRVIYPLK